MLDAERIEVAACRNGVLPPMEVVQASRVYKEGSNEIHDCAAVRRDLWDTHRLDRFLADLIDETDEPEGSDVCAARMIETWARGGAMTKVGSNGYERQSRFAIMWTLGGISAAYFANPGVRTAARAHGADRMILGWFDGLAQMVRAEIKGRREGDNENNIFYWQGFSILPTALLLRDPELLRLSRSVFNDAMREVTHGSEDPSRDGFLPRELQRGSKALGYQAYATYPIVGMAILSQSYGCDFLNSRWKRRQLSTLMIRTLEAGFDPEIVSNEIALREPEGPRVKPRKTAGVRHVPDLLYLLNRIDPSIYKRIDKGVATELDRPRPVFAADRGENWSVDRMGGSFSKLADAVEGLKDARSKRLAGACGGKS